MSERSTYQKLKTAQRRCNELFMRRFASKMPSDVGPEKGIVIGFVARHPGVSSSEISQRFGLSKSTVSETLSFLVGEGYLRYETNPSDKRKKSLFLDEKGREHDKKARAVFEEFDAYLVNLLGKEAVAALDIIDAALAKESEC